MNKESSQIRIEWSDEFTGATGHGEWLPNRPDIREGLDMVCGALNRAYPTMKHVVAERPAAAKENL